MGGGSKTTKTKSTVEIPAEIRQRGTQITNQAMAQYMGNPVERDPYSIYGNNGQYLSEGMDRTAGINQYQQGAGQQAWNSAGSYQPYVQGATQTAQGAFSQYGPGGNVYATTGATYNPDGSVNYNQFNQQSLSQFTNPYQSMVMDQGINKINEQRMLAQNTVNDSAAKAGAYGGARHGVLGAEVDKGYQGQATDFITNTLNQGYNNAVGQYNTERNALFQQQGLNNQTNAQGWNQGLGMANFLQGQGKDAQQFNTNAQQNLQDIGNTYMNQEQALKSNAYDSYLQQQDYGLSVLERLAAMNAMQPVNKTTTGTQTTPSQGWLGTALGAAGSFASFLSDETAKEDIKDRDPEAVLSAFSKVKPKSYKYKAEIVEKHPEHAPEGQRDGWVQQDYDKAFGRASKEVAGGKIGFDVANVLGDLAAAVHGLEKRTRKLKVS